MNPLFRKTLTGFAVGGVVFGLLAMWMNSYIGYPWFSNFGPVGIMALIGATTAGLAAPLVTGKGRLRIGTRGEDPRPD